MTTFNRPPWPPGQHFGPLPEDLQAQASIAHANAAGFNTATASTWALALLLGIEASELQRLDDLLCGLAPTGAEKRLLARSSGLAEALA
jgi:hypothetical protein